MLRLKFATKLKCEVIEENILKSSSNLFKHSDKFSQNSSSATPFITNLKDRETSHSPWNEVDFRLRVRFVKHSWPLTRIVRLRLNVTNFTHIDRSVPHVVHSDSGIVMCVRRDVLGHNRTHPMDESWQKKFKLYKNFDVFWSLIALTLSWVLALHSTGHRHRIQIWCS